MLTLDQLPPPSGYGGRWAYVDWNPAPVFIPDEQRPSLASRAAVLLMRSIKAVVGAWAVLADGQALPVARGSQPV